MKLRLTLLLMCLFSTGLFADAQAKKRSPKPPPPPPKSAPKIIKKDPPPKPTTAEFIRPVKMEKLLQNVKA